MNLWTKRLTVYGRVQGVGFRPTVCRMAQILKLNGFVRNFGAAVELVVSGSAQAIDKLKQQLWTLAKPILVECIKEEALEYEEYLKLCADYEIDKENFIAIFSSGAPKEPYATADLAVCPDCLAEMEQKGNSRQGYPYISCAQCGPRYTIMEQLPYDRAVTTMKRFKLCPSCTQEYMNMTDRRGHAETISCPECGPQLYGFTKVAGIRLEKKQALEQARVLLNQGNIILVKAVGGYNLVCHADRYQTIRQLRALKHRPTKPFAVLCGSMQQVNQLCVVEPREQKLLASEARPIVLLKKKAEAKQLLASGVADNCPELGVFLPPMGLFKQLCDKPLIVTSCNYSGQPIIYQDEEAERYFREHQEVAGLFAYDREILRPADDSVVKVIKTNKGIETKFQLLRRTRGYMPEPINMRAISAQSVLAVGAELEPSFCLANKQRFYCAQVPGELAELNTETIWKELEKDWERFLNIQPKLVVGDLHPGYISTLLGNDLAKEKNINFIQIQHHHAHALAVIAEHQLKEPVLAVCFDGTGYGANGNIWGGEFLFCKGLEYERVAHLEEVPMLGGDDSMKQAWKTAFCYLAASEKVSAISCSLEEKERYEVVKAALEQGINLIKNSSMGRVFDAVASILGILDYNYHQGACPQALETRARQAMDEDIWPLELHFVEQQVKDEQLCWSTTSLWNNLLAVDKLDQSQVKAAALGFHIAVIELVVKTAEWQYLKTGINSIALAGGCFANRILLEGCVEELQQRGFKVYFNEKVPVGDGGIALGQAYYGIMLEKIISQ